MTPGGEVRRGLAGEGRSRRVLLVLALALPLLVAFAFLYFRGLHHYDPPDCGGSEPRDNHESALEIVAKGTTTRTFHATGYAYFTAAVYSLLPRRPLSVQVVQILLLPWVVLAIGKVSRELAGVRGERVALIGSSAYYPFAYYSTGYSTMVPAFLALAAATPLAVGLHGERRSLGRSLLVGILLGIVVCHRPNFAIVGPFLVVSLWSATRSLWEALVRAFPVGLISAGLLAGMTVLNPPEPGQLLRGSQGLNRGLLQGTYQYSARWWDWEWIEDKDDPGTGAFYSHLRRIEKEAGEKYPHPAVQSLLRRDAVARILDEPWNTAKKFLVSSLRIWIFVPTHLESRMVKYVIAAQESALLLLAAVGFAAVGRKARAVWLLVGIMVTPMLLHALVTVEPRYSLPSRPVELALAVAGILWLTDRFKKRGAALAGSAVG